MNAKDINVLMIEDDPGDAEYIKEILDDEKYSSFNLNRVDNLASGINVLTKGGVDLVLLDLGLPDSQGIETLQTLQAKVGDIAIIVLTGQDDEHLGVKTVRSGAQDYLVKGKVDSNLLTRSIRHAIERKHLEGLLKQHTKELETANIELSQALDKLMKRVGQNQKSISPEKADIGTNYRGGIFLYPIEEAVRVRTLFISMFDYKLPTLAVTRIPPQRFRQALGRPVETIWLTTNKVQDMVCIDPSNITRLSLVFSEFFKHAPGGVVLFEGVEYLLSIVGFSDLLNFIQVLNDKIAMIDGTVYMILDLEILEDYQQHHLRRECLEPPRLGRIP